MAEKYFLIPTERIERTIDFMFQLTGQELENQRSQFVMSNPSAKMGLWRRPYAFTEQCVAMLSSVFNSDRAITVNILIMRAFVRLREMIASHSGCFRCHPAADGTAYPQKNGPLGFGQESEDKSGVTIVVRGEFVIGSTRYCWLYLMRRRQNAS